MTSFTTPPLLKVSQLLTPEVSPTKVTFNLTVENFASSMAIRQDIGNLRLWAHCSIPPLIASETIHMAALSMCLPQNPSSTDLKVFRDPPIQAVAARLCAFDSMTGMCRTGTVSSVSLGSARLPRRASYDILFATGNARYIKAETLRKSLEKQAFPLSNQNRRLPMLSALSVSDATTLQIKRLARANPPFTESTLMLAPSDIDSLRAGNGTLDVVFRLSTPLPPQSVLLVALDISIWRVNNDMSLQTIMSNMSWTLTADPPGMLSSAIMPRFWDTRLLDMSSAAALFPRFIDQGTRPVPTDKPFEQLRLRRPLTPGLSSGGTQDRGYFFRFEGTTLPPTGVALRLRLYNVALRNAMTMPSDLINRPRHLVALRTLTPETNALGNGNAVVLDAGIAQTAVVRKIVSCDVFVDGGGRTIVSGPGLSASALARRVRIRMPVTQSSAQRLQISLMASTGAPTLSFSRGVVLMPSGTSGCSSRSISGASLTNGGTTLIWTTSSLTVGMSVEVCVEILPTPGTSGETNFNVRTTLRSGEALDECIRPRAISTVRAISFVRPVDPPFLSQLSTTDTRVATETLRVRFRLGAGARRELSAGARATLVSDRAGLSGSRVIIAQPSVITVSSSTTDSTVFSAEFVLRNNSNPVLQCVQPQCSRSTPTLTFMLLLTRADTGASVSEGVLTLPVNPVNTRPSVSLVPASVTLGANTLTVSVETSPAAGLPPDTQSSIRQLFWQVIPTVPHVDPIAGVSPLFGFAPLTSTTANPIGAVLRRAASDEDAGRIRMSRASPHEGLFDILLPETTPRVFTFEIQNLRPSSRFVVALVVLDGQTAPRTSEVSSAVLSTLAIDVRPPQVTLLLQSGNLIQQKGRALTDAPARTNSSVRVHVTTDEPADLFYIATDFDALVEVDIGTILQVSAPTQNASTGPNTALFQCAQLPQNRSTNATNATSNATTSLFSVNSTLPDGIVAAGVMQNLLPGVDNIINVPLQASPLRDAELFFVARDCQQNLRSNMDSGPFYIPRARDMASPMILQTRAQIIDGEGFVTLFMDEESEVWWLLVWGDRNTAARYVRPGGRFADRNALLRDTVEVLLARQTGGSDNGMPSDARNAADDTENDEDVLQFGSFFAARQLLSTGSRIVVSQLRPRTTYTLLVYAEDNVLPRNVYTLREIERRSVEVGGGEPKLRPSSVLRLKGNSKVNADGTEATLTGLDQLDAVEHFVCLALSPDGPYVRQTSAHFRIHRWYHPYDLSWVAILCLVLLYLLLLLFFLRQRERIQAELYAGTFAVAYLRRFGRSAALAKAAAFVQRLRRPLESSQAHDLAYALEARLAAEMDKIAFTLTDEQFARVIQLLETDQDLIRRTNGEPDPDFDIARTPWYIACFAGFMAWCHTLCRRRRTPESDTGNRQLPTPAPVESLPPDQRRKRLKKALKNAVKQQHKKRLKKQNKAKTE
ncbi:MAG: hypothetical protein MHM6MM_002341 [Cercozoa sp. M6MM]